MKRERTSFLLFLINIVEIFNDLNRKNVVIGLDKTTPNNNAYSRGAKSDALLDNLSK
jgi:hypothetical protein